MAHYRSALRTAARTALAAALPGISWHPAWWYAATVEQLPRGGVATPKTLHRRLDVEDDENSVDLVVVIRKVLPDAAPEDDLDDYESPIATALEPVFVAVSDDFALVETDIRVSAEAEVPIGEIVFLYRVVIRRPEFDPQTVA